MSIVPVEVTMTGIEKLLGEFNRLNYRMQQKVIGKAGRAALDLIQPEVRANMLGLPFRNPPSNKNVRSMLARAVKKKTSNKSTTSIVSLFLDYKTGSYVRYAHLFEFGFNHYTAGRMRAYNMMTRPWLAKSDEIQRALAERMGQLLNEAAGR